MNNSKTPKIVVGVGLVAVYAAVAVFTLRGAHEHDDTVAQSVPAAAAAPMAAESASPPLAIPESADTLASSSAPTPEVNLPAVTPANAPRVSTAAKAPQAASPQVASEPKPRVEEAPVDRVAATTPPVRNDAEESSPGNSGGDVANAPADATSGKDGQITADVKSKVEAVAPDGAIDVTTRDGVVELAGSVPSQDVFEKALLAAHNVRDVRDVDASALTISN